MKKIAEYFKFPKFILRLQGKNDNLGQSVSASASTPIGSGLSKNSQEIPEDNNASENINKLSYEETEKIGGFLGWLKVFKRESKCQIEIGKDCIKLEIKEDFIKDMIKNDEGKVNIGLKNIVDMSLKRIFEEHLVSSKFENCHYLIKLNRF